MLLQAQILWCMMWMSDLPCCLEGCEAADLDQAPFHDTIGSADATVAAQAFAEASVMQCTIGV